MPDPLALRALYYPFARCTNEATLKRAVLLFDEIGFIDPTSPDSRHMLMNDHREVPSGVIENWNRIKDSYGLLQDRRILKIHDPKRFIQKHDTLLGASLRADLDDPEVWRVCTAPETALTWSMLRSKVPPSAFKFLNSDHLARINYGTANAKALLHREFLDWPDLREQGPDNSMFSDMDQSGDLQWGRRLRYLFHDGKIAYEMQRGRRQSKGKNGSRVEPEFSCEFPYTHGSSLNVNMAMLLSDEENLIPFTDSRIHHDLLGIKFNRALVNIEASQHRISGISRIHPEHLRRLAFTVLDTMVPDACIDRLSIEDCLKYRDSQGPAFTRLKSYLTELAAEIESQPYDRKYESELRRLIYSKVLPEAQRARDEGIAVYEKLFGKLAKKAITALTPTMGASIFAGLTLPEILLAGSAMALGAVLPDLVDAYVSERATRRSSLTYLLQLGP